MERSTDQNEQGTLPLVSVVIPTYNFGHLLPYTLNSLLAQTYTNWECIIVDDGSTDDTAQIVQAYLAKDKRISFFVQTNQGPAIARNTGILKAKGVFIQMLDADDLLQPDKLAYQIKALSESANVDVIYGPTFSFISKADEYNEVVSDLRPDLTTRPEISGSGDEVTRTFLATTLFPSAGLMRSSVVLSLGLLDISLKQAEDWDLFLRAAASGYTFKYLADTPDNARALIRKHDNNTTQNFFRLQYYVVKMRQKFAASCNNDSLLQFNRSRMLRDLEDLIFQIHIDLEKGDRKQAIERSFKTVALHPTFRYCIYALASIFVPAPIYGKLIKLSKSSLIKR